MHGQQDSLTLPDGRDLAYADYGPPDGIPIMFFPGFGHDRFGCFPPAASLRGCLRADARPLATLRFQAQHHSDLLLQTLSVTAPRCDRDVLARPEVREMFRRTFRTASAAGVGGLIDELTLLARPWGVELNRIRGANVELIYGDKDRLTPALIGAGVSQLLPASNLTLAADAGHQWIWAHWDALLELIAGQFNPEAHAAVTWASWQRRP